MEALHSVTVQPDAEAVMRSKKLAVGSLCAGLLGVVVYVLFPSVALLLAAVAIGLGVFAFRESPAHSTTRRRAVVGIGLGVAVFVTWGMFIVFFSSGSEVFPPTTIGPP